MFAGRARYDETDWRCDVGGKLPIDRARESQHDPRELTEDRQKFAEKEARLRRKAREHDDEKPSDEDARRPDEADA
jgi:hypothetical protein